MWVWGCRCVVGGSEWVVPWLEMCGLRLRVCGSVAPGVWVCSIACIQ